MPNHRDGTTGNPVCCPAGAAGAGVQWRPANGLSGPDRAGYSFATGFPWNWRYVNARYCPFCGREIGPPAGIAVDEPRPLP